MKIVPANSKATALVIFSGASTAVSVNVLAWAIDESGNVPPRPIVAPDLISSRVAVKFNERPQCFEWPNTMHASTAAFESYVA